MRRGGPKHVRPDLLFFGIVALGGGEGELQASGRLPQGQAVEEEVAPPNGTSLSRKKLQLMRLRDRGRGTH